MFRTVLVVATLLAAAAGTSVLPTRCTCQRLLQPTCGTDGVTYANPCVLWCATRAGTSTRGAELRAAHDGPCSAPAAQTSQAQAASPTAPKICVCPMHLSPVCGTDGTTYSNPCVLQCSAKGTKRGTGLRVAHEGACSLLRSAPADDVRGKACSCTREMRPTCGSDGVTYSNPCMLGCAAERGTSSRGAELRVAHEGACGRRAADSEEEAAQLASAVQPAPAAAPAARQHVLCACRRLWSPVCGTNGQTYANTCELRCAAGRGEDHSRAEGLRVAHQGAC